LSSGIARIDHPLLTIGTDRADPFNSAVLNGWKFDSDLQILSEKVHRIDAACRIANNYLWLGLLQIFAAGITQYAAFRITAKRLLQLLLNL
jgi:hypothetical protein